MFRTKNNLFNFRCDSGLQCQLELTQKKRLGDSENIAPDIISPFSFFQLVSLCCLCLGPTRKSFTQSRSSVSRTHQNIPSRAAPGPPGTAFTAATSPLTDTNVSCFHLYSQKHSVTRPHLSFFLLAVAHQNGGLKNTNHVANQRNSQHHNQRHPSSSNATRPFLPSNINQLNERGSNRPQPNLDCLRVPDQGAAG